VSQLRLFTGIELSAEVKAALVSAGEFVREAAPAWRSEKWVAEQNLHLTLAFIGDFAAEGIAQLGSDIGAAVVKARPFELTLEGLRAVPTRRRCSMLWAAFGDAVGGSAALAHEVESAADCHGVERGRHAFVPHATVVRARHPHTFPADALAAINERDLIGQALMSVSSVTLFSSTLTRRGPVYEVLERWEMTGRI
jgi:2'-5' RNA ligase